MSFGQEETVSTEVQAVESLAKTYSDQLINKVAMAKDSPQVQKVLGDLGLQTYVKDVNKETIKNLLTAYGAFRLAMGVKSNFLKIGVAGLALYLFSQNKEKIQMAINNINIEPTPDVQNIIPIDSQSMV